MTGKFIVIEGQGFSGKTTQVHLLAEKLKEKSLDVIETREPGGVPAAEKIREGILKKRQEGISSPEHEVVDHYAAREIFINELIKPSLKDDKWVISSRFSASTKVYQGFEGGIDLDFIEKLDEKVVGKYQPDLYLLLDVPEEEIWKRIKNSERDKHSYNESDLEKIKIRRDGYLKLAGENPNWILIDGVGSQDEVHEKIWQAVSKKFNLPT